MPTVLWIEIRSARSAWRKPVDLAMACGRTISRPRLNARMSGCSSDRITSSIGPAHGASASTTDSPAANGMPRR